MKLAVLHEATVANIALDVVGAIPGAEPADAANALLHIKQGEYFQAAMSILSLIPAVGDVIGKSAKYLAKGSPKVAKFVAKHGDDIAKYWPKAKEYIAKSKALEPYAEHLDAAVKEVLGNKSVSEARKNPLKPSPDPDYKPEEEGGQDADASGTSSKSCKMGVNKGTNRKPYTGPTNYD
jgi:hypothetical protein